MLFDINKKFYVKNKDIIILERKNAIKEAIKNVLGINTYDVPMCDDIGANINYSQLKSISHSNAYDIVQKIDTAIKNIEYVDTVDVTFFYETSKQNIIIKVVTKDLTESIDMNINLSDWSL